MRLSLAALETLAVIAYKQPVTLPEIQAISWSACEWCHQNTPREEADHDCRAQGGHRSSDSIQKQRVTF